MILILNRICNFLGNILITLKMNLLYFTRYFTCYTGLWNRDLGTTCNVVGNNNITYNITKSKFKSTTS